MQIREDQVDALVKLRTAIIEGYLRIILQAPTAWGKTVLAVEIIRRARELGRRILFTVPALELVDQTVAFLRSENIYGVGVIQAHHELTDMAQPVQVASVQTLMRRWPIEAVDLVLIDEAHKWFHFYEKWFRDPAWQSVPIIGLTATPWHKGLGAYYGKLIIASTTAEAIADGHLCPFRVYAPPQGCQRVDLKGVHIQAGDYVEDELAQRMQPLTADIVATWQKHGEGRSTFVFAVNCLHAKQLQQQFQACGISAEYMDAHTSREERANIRERFHDGDVRVVCNVGVLTTGVDWDVRCLVLARPTRSEILFTQMVGRALRTADGKDHALILDHSDTHARLGFVTDIFHDTLHDGKAALASKVDAIRLPKECIKCGYLRPPSMAKCPVCGHLHEAACRTEVKPGELVELKSKPKGAAAKFPDRGPTFAMLKYYAKQRNYKPGWAANQFHGLYGEWPNGLDLFPETWPTADLVMWIKSRQIRWARSKNNPANQSVG